MKFAGREYLNQLMELMYLRAPTDNDMYIKSEWKKAHYDKAYTSLHDRGRAGAWCENYKPCIRCNRDSTEDS